jgi:hypothetical protein
MLSESMTCIFPSYILFPFFCMWSFHFFLFFFISPYVPACCGPSISVYNLSDNQFYPTLPPFNPILTRLSHTYSLIFMSIIPFQAASIPRLSCQDPVIINQMLEPGEQSIRPFLICSFPLPSSHLPPTHPLLPPTPHFHPTTLLSKRLESASLSPFPMRILH